MRRKWTRSTALTQPSDRGRGFGVTLTVATSPGRATHNPEARGAGGSRWSGESGERSVLKFCAGWGRAGVRVSGRRGLRHEAAVEIEDVCAERCG